MNSCDCYVSDAVKIIQKNPKGTSADPGNVDKIENTSIDRTRNMRINGEC